MYLLHTSIYIYFYYGIYRRKKCLHLQERGSCPLHGREVQTYSRRFRAGKHRSSYCSLSWARLVPVSFCQQYCFTSHRQRGHLETVPPFTVPCEGREAQLINRTHWESNPGPSRGSLLHYGCATPAPTLFILFH